MATTKFDIGEKVFETEMGRTFEITSITIGATKTTYKGYLVSNVTGLKQIQEFEESKLTKDRFIVKVFDNETKKYVVNKTCNNIQVSRETTADTFGGFHCPKTKTELSFEDFSEVERELKALSELDEFVL